MSIQGELEVRLATADDEPFFFSGVLRGFRSLSPQGHYFWERTYYREHHAAVTKILGRPMAKLVIACLRSEPGVAIGFLLVELSDRPVIHYTYVKRVFRHMGVAKALWESQGLRLGECSFTHYTRSCRGIVERHPGLLYDPYLLQETA